MLAGCALVYMSKRQPCIAMSSTEAELYALAELAIELLHIIALLAFLGCAPKKAVEACTDNKGAYDLCHRFTSAQNSRHIDRKIFKMRELRGAGKVIVRHVDGPSNPADLFTKILDKATFLKHTKVILGHVGDTGAEHARRTRTGSRDGAP